MQPIERIRSTPMDPLEIHLNQARPALLRSARNRLRNPAWAEDAVSETLLAALQRRPAFDEPARIRAWLFGVLRHKVADQLRLHLGDEATPAPHELDDDELHEIGDPCPAADPMHRAGDRQFIQALHGQLQRLPRTHAHAFYLRECLGRDAAEICQELAITSGNLWVMLHRARSRLRQGLAAHYA